MPEGRESCSASQPPPSTPRGLSTPGSPAAGDPRPSPPEPCWGCPSEVQREIGRDRGVAIEIASQYHLSTISGLQLLRRPRSGVGNTTRTGPARNAPLTALRPMFLLLLALVLHPICSVARKLVAPHIGLCNAHNVRDEGRLRVRVLHDVTVAAAAVAALLGVHAHRGVEPIETIVMARRVARLAAVAARARNNARECIIRKGVRLVVRRRARDVAAAAAARWDAPASPSRAGTRPRTRPRRPARRRNSPAPAPPAAVATGPAERPARSRRLEPTTVTTRR